MQPKCQVCGQFISEHELWDCDSVSCCEEHDFIKICAPCLEIFEKFGDVESCVIETVRYFKKRFDSEIHPRYACPNCDYISFSFNSTCKHMHTNKHYYQGIGTYPIYIHPSQFKEKDE